MTDAVAKLESKSKVRHVKHSLNIPHKRWDALKSKKLA